VYDPELKEAVETSFDAVPRLFPTPPVRVEFRPKYREGFGGIPAFSDCSWPLFRTSHPELRRHSDRRGESPPPMDQHNLKGPPKGPPFNSGMALALRSPFRAE